METWRSGFHTPTLEEIADHFGYGSPTGARDHLRALETKGMIRREPGKARSIQITDLETLSRIRPFADPGPIPKGETGIPIIGSIAAGTPLEAIERSDRILPIPERMFGRGDIFALEVRGDSMVDIGIREGDLAIIVRRDTVESGEIAAVIIDGEATLKTVVRQGRQLILRAANPAFPDRVFRSGDPETVVIAGKYIGLVRSECWKEGLAA